MLLLPYHFLKVLHLPVFYKSAIKTDKNIFLNNDQVLPTNGNS